MICSLTLLISTWKSLRYVPNKVAISESNHPELMIFFRSLIDSIFLRKSNEKTLKFIQFILLGFDRIPESLIQLL